MTSKSNTGSKNGVDPNLDQIREILFGEQSRDYNQQIANLREQNAADLAELREEMAEQLQSLHEQLNGELSALNKRLKDENADRTTAIKKLGSDLKELLATLNRKSAGLEERIATREQQIRQHVEKLSKSMETDYRACVEELSNAVDEELEDLRGTRADRTELGELFQEFALRLTGELKRPAPKN